METQVVQYAGFWKRFVACLIDAVIIGVFEFIVFIPFLGLLGLSVLTHEHEIAPGFLFAAISAYFTALLIAMIAAWLYYALMESSKKQATLGKLALGLKVTDMSGARISFGRATGRHFGKILSALIFYVGYMMAGFTQQKQALHDIMAGCLVINKP